MDIHFRSMLRHHCLHPFFSQLPDLVLSRPWYDHLHRLVLGCRRSYSRPGFSLSLRRPLSLSKLLFLFNIYVCVHNLDRRRYPFGADKTGALLHWRHQYSLHLRRPRCHCVSPPSFLYIYFNFQIYIFFAFFFFF